MHAVMVVVDLKDNEKALQHLRDRVVPTVKKQPGFVAGYFLAPKDDKG